jgi:methylenetetrahydrofolate dehydrogenase (NADP+)/methenyltetrahydrofolate cyclohydrolase
VMALETKILDGKGLADIVLKEVAAEVDLLLKRGHRAPGLCTVLVGDHSASALYVRNKRKRAKEVGIESFHYELPESAPESHLLELIAELNRDPHIDGILVQLPLPRHMSEHRIIEAIDPNKDVDGFHPTNLGRLFAGRPSLVPCTPLGCMRLLKETGVNLNGANAVVIGRSNIVGKPMAALLLNADASVSICHRHTKDLKDFTRKADVIVVAAGNPNLITADHIKEGVVIIDVGINRCADSSIIGDVDVASVKGKAGVMTPVPGGVGPMTIAMLLQNTLTTYHLRRK